MTAIAFDSTLTSCTLLMHASGTKSNAAATRGSAKRHETGSRVETVAHCPHPLGTSPPAILPSHPKALVYKFINKIDGSILLPL